MRRRCGDGGGGGDNHRAGKLHSLVGVVAPSLPGGLVTMQALEDAVRPYALRALLSLSPACVPAIAFIARPVFELSSPPPDPAS